MYFVKTPYIFPLFYHNIIWKMPGRDKVIYITFDDGPDKNVTLQILDILNKFGAKATFFCIGKKAEENPDIINKIISSGHTTGNHSYDHRKVRYNKSKDFIYNIEMCNKVLRSKLLRPPYGRISFRQIRLLRNRYKIILWSLLPGDFDKRVSKEICLTRSIKHTKSGTIIVFHDNLIAKDKVLYVLPKYIKHFTNKGFIFKAIDAAMFR